MDVHTFRILLLEVNDKLKKKNDVHKQWERGEKSSSGVGKGRCRWGIRDLEG